MPKVHVSGQNRNIPAHALNAPIKNTFEQSNIRFHVDGNYLTDMSDKGIEKFIKKHVNSKSGFLGGMGLGWGGKDLDVKEVKAFIQAVAANAETMEGFTFDLKDPELGLYDDDDITLKDIQHSFQLDYKPTGSSNTSVSFVDATGVQSDYKQAKTHETQQHGTFKSAQQTHRTLQTELQSAQKSRDKIADRIGDKSAQQLLETDNKLNQVNSRIEDLNSGIADVRSQLSQANSPQDRKQELRLMLRGMELELKELKTEQKGLKSNLEDNHGFWSFVGGGSSLEDLREANAKVDQAQQALNDNKVVYDQARERWQSSVSQREAVEGGKSWSEVHTEETPAAVAAKPVTPAASAEPAASASKPDSSSPAVAPTTPPTPVQAAPPTATPNALAVASEGTLQQLLTLDPAKQREALANVPVEQRELVLKMADDYWVGGQPGNVFGLGQADFEAMQGLQNPVAQLRLNALLSWDEASATYLKSASDRSKADILSHLNQQLFDQQLAQQAAALKAKLAPPVSEPSGPPVSPPAAPAPASPSTNTPEETLTTQANPGVTAGPESSPTPANGLDLKTYAALSPEDKLQQFKLLSSEGQATVFQAADPVGKVKVMATLLSQGEAPERVSTLASSMSAADRQVGIQELSDVLAQTQGPAPQKTELNMVLGMLRQLNGTAPDVAPAPTPVTPPVAAPPAVKPPAAVERPKLVVEDANTPPAVAPTLAPSPKVDAPVKAAEPTPAEPTPEEMGRALLVELAKLAQTATAENPAHLQAFAGLSTEDKALVFKVASPDIQAELLFAIGETAQTTERKQVLKSLAPEQKTALADFYGELLPAFGASDQDMTDAIRRFITELGQKPPAAQSPATQAATATQPAVAPQIGGSQTLGQTASVKPDSLTPPQTQTAVDPATASQSEGGLDMSMKLTQLTQELNNKSWTGGLMNSSLVNELVDQIWDRGTQENRQNLAKLLVTEGRADKLSFLVVDYDRSFEKVASIISAPNFPVKAFMAGVEKDDRAGLILSNMAELATESNALGQAAKSFVMSTLAEYKDGVDREGPIESAKKSLQQSGSWEKLPEISKEMDNILNTYWN